MLSVKDLNEIELIKAQNEKLKEQNRELQRDNEQGRKIISQHIDKFQEIEELCRLAKYKGGDDIYYDDILDLIKEWIYD